MTRPALYSQRGQPRQSERCVTSPGNTSRHSILSNIMEDEAIGEDNVAAAPEIPDEISGNPNETETMVARDHFTSLPFHNQWVLVDLEEVVNEHRKRQRLRATAEAKASKWARAKKLWTALKTMIKVRKFSKGKDEFKTDGVKIRD